MPMSFFFLSILPALSEGPNGAAGRTQWCPRKIDLSRLKNATSPSPFPLQPITRSSDVLLGIVAPRPLKAFVRVTVIFYSEPNPARGA